jgi:hypothetical protein
MTKVDLDLGKKPSDMGKVEPHTADEPYYPSFHYSTTYDLMGEDFPMKGKMVIEYEITRSVETKVPGEPDRYDCDVDVKKIVAVDGKVSAPAKSGSSADEALDTLAKALHEKMEAEEDEENEGDPPGDYVKGGESNVPRY